MTHHAVQEDEMESRVVSLLVIITVAVTCIAASYILIGPGYAVEGAVVSLLALGAWLRFCFRQLPSPGSIVTPYIFVIVLILLLSTFRFWSGYGAVLQSHWPSFFTSQLSLSPSLWFVLFVTIPVSLMLLGGYYLSKGTPLGLYMAWWTFFYAVAESLLQYRMEFAAGGYYDHRYFSGALVALLLLVTGVTGCQRLLRTHVEEIPPKVEPVPLTDRQIRLWTVFLFSLAVVYGASLYLQAGLLPVGVIVGSMMGGMVGWHKTTARHPADPYTVVPLYLLLQCFFFIHVGEETISPTPFNQSIAVITGNSWPDDQFIFFIGLIGPVVWVFGAWSLWRRQAFGNFLLWFMIVGMILGEPTHLLVFPVVMMNKFGTGYQYFSGMFTALFPMVPAILALVAIRREHKERSLQPIPSA